MKNQNKTMTIIRWTARISGSLLLAFFLFFLLAHLFGENESGEGFRSTAEVITFIFFPISTVIGLSLALKWEGLGGLIIIIGMVGLFILRPELLNSPYIVIPIVPGILYGLYWLLSRKQLKTEPNTG